MKILILMPCDEQHVYAAAGIYKALPNEMKDITFPMPMFMDYLIENKIVGNWIMAFFDSLISMKNIYNAAMNRDLLIIGTAPVDMEFDIVFNFQDIEQDLPYKDAFLEKIREAVKSDEMLLKMVSNLYSADASKMPLHNCIATADFITKYMKTDVKNKLEVLRKQYEKQLKGVILDDEGISNIK
jgi:hypothetical protein